VWLGQEAKEMFLSAEDVAAPCCPDEQIRQAQKAEAIGRLAGGIAHDFNNLLGVIGGYADLVLRELGAEDPRRHRVVQIRRAADRAAALTRQLLAFSRKQVLQPRVLDVGVVVSDLEEMLRRLIGEDIQVVVIKEPGLGHVRADPSQLEQVLLNLAANARDAMPSGGTLTIETANVDLGPVYVALHPGARPGRYVMLAISDTGVGMDAATLSRVFEPFFTTKELGRGTGLGLATVYGIVKQSEGCIWAYSEPGRGTTFKVYLPRADASLDDEPLQPPAGPSPVGTETVLVVEDEEALRSLIAEMLTCQGYQVVEAASPRAALEAAERGESPFDLVVTDLIMPGMSGRELGERLTALFPGLGVLYISGYTDDVVMRRGLLDPRMNFLQKPFTLDDLAQKVREALDSLEAP
jgi:two-component system cell cycle sensor histidine kinase/response regulator CckA